MDRATESRLRKEIKMLADDPPPGVVAWPVEPEKYDRLEAQITGPDETPYAAGVFKLEITLPPRYPFEPPRVRFVTPIYHPNIDDGGRICLDTLKMQPQGSWSPSVNISTLLTSIRLLMAHPNPDDGLMPDITELYRNDLEKFELNAKASTKKHAFEAEDVAEEDQAVEVAPMAACERRMGQASESKDRSPGASAGPRGSSDVVYDFEPEEAGDEYGDDVDEYEDEYIEEEDEVSWSGEDAHVVLDSGGTEDDKADGSRGSKRQRAY